MGDFDELLEFIMPWRDGLFTVLSAFFDASMRDTGTYCVAGFAYGRDSAKKAESEWRALMGDRIGHLTDLNARKGEFEGITGEEAGALLTKQVAIIRKYATYGVAVSCNVNELEPLLPTKCAKGSERLLEGFRSPYAVCSHLVMHRLGNLSKDGIAYAFEHGDHGRGNAETFTKYVLTEGPMRATYKCRSYGFFEKKDMRLLETADVIAWEWAKNIDRINSGKQTRRSLFALTEDRKDRPGGFAHLHLTGYPLQRYLDKMGKIAIAETIPEVISIVESSIGMPAEWSTKPKTPASSSSSGGPS